MNNQPLHKDRSSRGDWLVMCLILGLPFATLAVEYAFCGLFQRLLRPFITPETITTFIPKLQKDMDFYAAKWPHLDPDPYLYWYFATLAICTVVGLSLVPRSFRLLKVPARRQAMMEQWKLSISRFPMSLFPAGIVAIVTVSGVILGLLIIIGLILFGPVQFGGRITVGLRHDCFMALLLACYCSTIAGLPGIIQLIFIYRRAAR